MAEKKIPMRTCIVCREVKPKKDLVRIVKYEDVIRLDISGKANGRGCYICSDGNCIDLCCKKRALNKTFKCNVSEDTYKTITEDYVEYKNR